VNAWFAGQPLPSQIGLAILAAALLTGLVILVIFAVRKFIKLGHQDDLGAKDRVGLQIEFIKTAAQILGGAFFLFGLYFTYQNLVLNQEKNRADMFIAQEKHTTDLYTKAIEQLGSDKMEVRLGGIYALERIARDSEKDHGPIMEVLTAYVREKAPWPPKRLNAAKEPPAASGKPASGLKKPTTKPAPEVKPPTDIQAILTVLGHRTRIYKKAGDQRLDLRRTDLRGADLHAAHLEGAGLDRAHLERALLWDAHLQGAHLREAHLEGADLDGAHLERADLQEAHLERAHLKAYLDMADLRRAYLQGADLKEAYLEIAYLSRAYLQGAFLAKASLWKAYLDGAHLEGADLYRANLEGADLRGATGLTQKQIDSAFIDKKTTLPDHLKKAAPEKAKPK
jgi:uncharacterized protein YjbI with pentapeptide repeats